MRPFSIYQGLRPSCPARDWLVLLETSSARKEHKILKTKPETRKTALGKWRKAEGQQSENSHVRYRENKDSLFRGNWFDGVPPPDSENGRFEVLGWAKSFTTRGSIPITVDWERGSIGELEVGFNRRLSIRRSCARGRLV